MAPMTGPGLLGAVGLLPDGPVVWGRPVRSSRSGVYIVELPAPHASALLELALVGKWLERATDLRLDGDRPSSRALQARLARDWLADQTVLFIGSVAGSLAERVAALERTPAGDRLPYGAGLRLHLLRGIEACRIWWAETDAPEEYEDALLDAFAEGVGPAPASAPRGFVAPFAVVERPTGEVRPTGISGAFVPDVPEIAPPTSVVELAPAETPRQLGAPAPRAVARAGSSPVSGTAPGKRPAARRSAARSAAGSADEAPTGGSGGSAAAASARPPAEVVHLSPEGLARLQAELRELRIARRPEIVRRVTAARELGDLSENSEYHAAREELGFLDGRIQAVEARLRAAVVLSGEDGAGRTILGSTVVVETDGVERTLRLVGSVEADLAAGRISVASPVGKALLGRTAGDEVTVTTPAGAVVYRVIRVE